MLSSLLLAAEVAKMGGALGPRRVCGLLGRDRCALGSSYVINPA